MDSDLNDFKSSSDEAVLQEAPGTIGEGPRLKGQREVETALSSRFAILRPIGAQQNVEYYLAQPVDRGDAVQLKVLSERRAGEVKEVELFYLEARAAAQLSHENILRTGTPEQARGVHYCVIERHDAATTLRTLLDRGGWLQIPDAVHIALRLAGALTHAHERGVLHLKLHPASVLAEPNGRVLLTGFGVENHEELAWAQRRRTLDCAPEYQSPEQLSGAPLDHRSDLYSLGVVLYEMLTDRLPCDSRDAAIIKQKVNTQSTLPPHIVRSRVPETLSHIVMSLLERNPGRRLQSAASFQDGLASVLYASA